MTNKTILLAKRPNGMPSLDDFEIVDAPIPAVAAGELLVRTIYLSVDPYMRGRMNAPDVTASRHYAQAFELGKPLSGGLVGEVIESKVDGYSAGNGVNM